MKHLMKYEKKKEQECEKYLKRNFVVHTTSFTLLSFAKQSSLYLCLIVYSLFEC